MADPTTTTVTSTTSATDTAASTTESPTTAATDTAASTTDIASNSTTAATETAASSAEATTATTEATSSLTDVTAATDATTGVTTDAVTGATDAVIGSNDSLAATGDAATSVTDAASATTDAVATSLEGTAAATSDALPSVYDAAASTDAATTAATGGVSALADAGVSSIDAAASVATSPTAAVSDAAPGGAESLANATSEVIGAGSTLEQATTAAPAALTGIGDGPVTGVTATLVDSGAAFAGDGAASPVATLPQAAVETAVSGGSAVDAAPLADVAAKVDATAVGATTPTEVVGLSPGTTFVGPEVHTGLVHSAEQLAATSGPVPSANSGAGGPNALENLGGVAADFLATAADAPRVDLVALTDALAAPEARLGLLTAIGLIGVSRAYGVGVIGTVQPLMEACTASIRMTFQSVRLVPCTAGATASGFGSVGNVGGTTDAARRSRPFGVLGERVARAGQEQVARAAELPGQAVERLRPWAAHGSSLVVRVVIWILATLSVALAAVGAVRHERNRPRARRYS